MEKNYFELTSRPVKGTEVELSTETIIMPPLTLYHYSELGADKQIKEVMQYYLAQEQEKAQAMLVFSELNSKIIEVGAKGLSDDEVKLLQECLEKINAPISFDKRITDIFLDLALMSITRNYPNMTKTALMKEIDFNSIQEIISLLQSQDKSLKKSPTPILVEKIESEKPMNQEKKAKQPKKMKI